MNEREQPACTTVAMTKCRSTRWSESEFSKTATLSQAPFAGKLGIKLNMRTPLNRGGKS